MRESCTSGSERGKPRKGLTYLPISLINISAVLDLEAVIISGGLGNSIGRLFSEKWGEPCTV